MLQDHEVGRRSCLLSGERLGGSTRRVVGGAVAVALLFSALFTAGFVRYAGVSFIEPPADQPAAVAASSPRVARNITPWFKLDYVVPMCAALCHCEARLHPGGGAAEAWARGTDKALFGGVPASFATTGLQLHDALAILRAGGITAGSPTAPSGYAEMVVNVGAACGWGGAADPTFTVLLDRGVSGVLFDPQNSASLFAAYPQRSNVRVMAGVGVDQTTAPALFSSSGVPRQFAVLKVDVDSFDCGILASVLADGYAPLLIFGEINTVLPPPIRFSAAFNISAAIADRYKPALWTNANSFFGCSLSMMGDVLIPHGYRLVEVDGWDALWAREDVADLFGPLPSSLAAAFEAGFSSRLSNLQASGCFDPGHPVMKVYDPVVLELVNRIRAGQGQGHGSDEATTALRRILERSAVKDSSGRAMPFIFGSQGPSDNAGVDSTGRVVTRHN